MDIDEFLDREILGEGKSRSLITEDKADRKVKYGTLSEINSILEKGNFNELDKSYFDLWEQVSREKLHWDNRLYTELDEAGKKIREILRKLSFTVKKEKNTIKEFVRKVNLEMDNKNYESALKLYSEIIDMRNGIPDFLLEERKELNETIFQTYQKLHDVIDSKFISNFRLSISQVHSLIRKSFSSFENGKVEVAMNFYEEALEIYKELPHGFLLQKIELGNSLLALYKNLSISLQITNLRRQLRYGKLIELSKFTDTNKLDRLSQIIKSHEEKAKETRKVSAISHLRELSGDGHLVQKKNLPAAYGGPTRNPKESYDRLRRIAEQGRAPKTAKKSSVPNVLNLRKKPLPINKDLLNKLIARKLERASLNLERGLHSEAKKNLKSVLRLDPNNRDARQMLAKIAS